MGDPGGNAQDHTQDNETSVLIIGAGPSGATAALILSNMGVPCLAVSRHRTTANTPRAHIFNQRAMEVLRDAGVEGPARATALPAARMMHTSWLGALNGEEYARLYAWGNRPSRLGDFAAASPCAMSDLPQSRLEPILVDEAARRGARFRFHTEFVAQRGVPAEAGGGVETTLRDRASGEQYTVRSRYLVGADGARSDVLQSLGIPVDGKQLNTAFNVEIEADLARYMAHRPGTLNWVLNPQSPHWSAVGNFRMVAPWHHFVVSMHPSTTDGREFEPSEEDILQRLRQMIGDESVAIKILSTYRWSINNQVARTYQRGNVICIGDAVHRHPPINGLGSNTCVSDALNVAWKLALVLRGVAGPEILESVTVERKPVGDAVVKRANDGMAAHRAMWALIGLTQEEREAKTALMEQASPEGATLRRQFNEAIENMDREHNALGMNMNQRYLDSPLTVVEPGDAAPDFSHLDLDMQQAVCTYPGYHLPHVWLAKDGQSERVSTLDVCGRGAFTLLVTIGGEAWRAAAEAVADEAPLRVVMIGWRRDYLDVYRDWDKIKEVNDDGAILVRPDNFISWRCMSMPADPAGRLRSVVRRVLHI